MNLNHVKLFVAVYRAGSFTSVAKDLNVVASSVSRAIATLEGQLETRLFQRTTRTLTPTQAGERYFQRVEALVEEFDLVHQEVMDHSLKPSGTLRVTASISFAQIVITPLLKEFCERYPDIHLELSLSDARTDIVAEQFDVAIRHGVLPDSSLVARRLVDVNYLLAASPQYLQQTTPVLAPKDIQRHSLVTFTYPEFNAAWRFRRNGEVDDIPIKPILSLTTASAIKECAINGMGITMLADWSIKEELSDGRLEKVLPEWDIAGANADSAIWLVYPSRAFIPAKTAAFANFLLSKL